MSKAATAAQILNTAQHDSRRLRIKASGSLLFVGACCLVGAIPAGRELYDTPVGFAVAHVLSVVGCSVAMLAVNPIDSEWFGRTA